jgi:hypothetical protein
VLAATALVLLLLIPVFADASVEHPFKETFGSAAQPTFTNAGGMAVDQSTGDLLVIEYNPTYGGSGTLSRYHENGTPDNFSALSGTNVIDGHAGEADATPQEGVLSSEGFGPQEVQVAVAPAGAAGGTAGDIYVTDAFHGKVDVFASTGQYLTQLSAVYPCGVAVDPGGDVFVGDYEENKVDKFVPSVNGSPPPPTTYTKTGEYATTHPCQVAAGAGPTAGFVFATEYSGMISKIDSSTGTVQYTFPSNSNKTVTVDPVSGHVYVATGSEVKEYDASGPLAATQASSIQLASTAQGVAVNGTTGNVYVARASNAHVEVFGTLLLPEATTGAASAITKHTATVSGHIDPSGGPAASCQFEYGPGFSEIAACIPPGPFSSAQDVTANLSNLQAGTYYPYRISANNGNIAHGAERAFTTEPAVELSTGAATAVTSNSATLNGTVDPAGQPVSDCHFDYGTTASYGQSVPCTPAPGSGSGAVAVHADISGLTGGITYFFRLVATNADGTTAGTMSLLTTSSAPVPSLCPNAIFRTGPAANLPDCRAYEQVSPSGNNKDGANAGVNSGSFGATMIAAMAARADGERLIWPSFLPYSGSTTGITYTFRSTRAAGGWTTAQLSPPVGELPHPALANASLIDDPNEAMSAGVITTSDQFDPLDQDFRVPAQLGTHADVYVRNPAGSMTWVSRGNTNAPDAEPFDAEYVGRSANLDHVLFGTAERMPGVTGASGVVGGRALYDRSGGQTSLVNLGNAGNPVSPCGAVTGAYDPVTRHATAIDSAVSNDGSRVAFTAPEPGASDPNSPYHSSDPSCLAPSQVYVREGNQITYDASASQRTVPDPGGTQPATYQGSSADGSEVFFTSSQALTNLATPFAGGETGPFLYRYDVPTGQLTLLTPNEPGGPHVTGVIAVSADGAHVYFMRGGELKMYTGGQITLVATGLGQDSNQPLTGVPERQRGARLSPDGSYILFAATNNVTAFDSHGKAELYLYHAGDPAGPVCVSCNWDGHAPAGGAQLDGAPVAGLEVGPTTRNVTDDGRAFFQSEDNLVPQDTNGKLDVYEYSDGAPHLISTGHSPAPSPFIDSSANGRDVFFATSESLVPQDTDSGNFDAYDARVEGGLASQYQTPPAGCVEEACQGEPASAPGATVPGSLVFSGLGNLPAPVVKKPVVKRLTNAQKLARALKACKKRRKSQRAKCRSQARKRYGKKASKSGRSK